jgi:hypothetical protein
MLRRTEHLLGSGLKERKPMGCPRCQSEISKGFYCTGCGYVPPDSLGSIVPEPRHCAGAVNFPDVFFSIFKQAKIENTALPNTQSQEAGH